jgi:pectate lyase
MRKLTLTHLLTFLVVTLYLLPQAVNAQSCPGGAPPAFPGAEGFGACTKGGRGGRIIEVTNLNDSGAGSLRAALNATGPRIIVFRVSGTINLLSDIVLQGDSQSYVTIAGQSSPGGVQTKGNYGIWVRDGVHDVIMRFLRVRPGGPATGAESGNALGAYAPYSPVYNMIVDHCSMQWGTDALAMVYQQLARDITFSWNIIAEGVRTSTISSGTGIHVGNGPNITTTFHHNLVAHQYDRAPLIAESSVADFRNNVIYNWGSDAAEWGILSLNTSAFGNNVNNHYIAGANSGSSYFWLENGGSGQSRGGTKLYTSGNWGPNCPSGCSDDWSNGFVDGDYGRTTGGFRLASASVFRASTPFSAPAVTTDPTNILKDKVLATVGAYKPGRDAVDNRIINDVRNRTGNINNIGDGGPWPDLASGAPSLPADSDHDGIPDAWEIANGLNPNDASDGSRIASNGYTNVENYLNALAGDPIPGGSSQQLAAPSNLSVQ